jgi:hypothetical protein
MFKQRHSASHKESSSDRPIALCAQCASHFSTGAVAATTSSLVVGEEARSVYQAPNELSDKVVQFDLVRSTAWRDRSWS